MVVCFVLLFYIKVYGGCHLFPPSKGRVSSQSFSRMCRPNVWSNTYTQEILPLMYSLWSYPTLFCHLPSGAPSCAPQVTDGGQLVPLVAQGGRHATPRHPRSSWESVPGSDSSSPGAKFGDDAYRPVDTHMSECVWAILFALSCWKPLFRNITKLFAIYRWWHLASRSPVHPVNIPNIIIFLLGQIYI